MYTLQPRHYLTGLGAITLIIFSLCANAFGNRSIEEKLIDADLVFEGTVVDVQYRSIEKQSDTDQDIPYTFVSFRIATLLKGKVDGQFLTLRFFGGVDKNGVATLVSGAPLFDLGDHDLLLVKGNNVFPCPLVDCAEGRYRFINGFVVNDLGQKIYLGTEGQLLKGEVIQSEEIATHRLSEGVTIEQRETNELGVGEVQPLDQRDSGIVLASPPGFKTHMDDTIRVTHSHEQLENITTFENADPDQPFVDDMLLVQDPAGMLPPDLPPDHGFEEVPEEEIQAPNWEALNYEDMKRESQLANTSEREHSVKSTEKTQHQSHSGVTSSLSPNDKNTSALSSKPRTQRLSISILVVALILSAALVAALVVVIVKRR